MRVMFCSSTDLYETSEWNRNSIIKRFVKKEKCDKILFRVVCVKHLPYFILISFNPKQEL